MNHLVKVIGLAPSELPLGEFKIKLKAERDRVRRGLDYFRDTVLLKGKKSKKVAHSTKLTALLKEAGLSPKDMIKGIEMLKKMEAENKKNQP